MCQDNPRLFLFGYGSLIWRCGFDYEYKFNSCIKGYKRVFQYVDTTHRGTLHYPGRCANVIYTGNEQEDAVWGTCYLISEQQADTILKGLDTREKGYTKKLVPVYVEGYICAAMALLYVQNDDDDDNDVMTEEEKSIEYIAKVIASARGVSGPNVDYLNRLYHALKEMNGLDEYMIQLYQLVQQQQQLLQQQQQQHEQESICESKVKGKIVIDSGATEAISNRSKALLPCGILTVISNFKRGDIVELICAVKGTRVGLGVSNFSVDEIQQIKGKHSSEIRKLASSTSVVIEHVVSKENLILL